MFLSNSAKSYLGVDIGASGIKIVELRKEGAKVRLSSYGVGEIKDSLVSPNWQNEPGRIARMMKEVYKKAGMISKNAVAALPTYSVFSSIITLSNVDPGDIESAVKWEAKKVIPLPLEEMVIDWVEVKDDAGIPEASGAKNLKVLLTGAPRNLIEKYMAAFKEAEFNLISLETETLSLIRSLAGNDRSSLAIAEIGSGTTDIFIVEKGIPVLSRSLDVGGLSITKAVSESLNVNMDRAEQFKFDLGMSSLESDESSIPKTITDSITPIVNEIKYALKLYQSKNGGSPEKIILSGGSALLMNFTNYLSKVLDRKVIIGDPWARVHCPVDLLPKLKELGPRLAVAVGLAMREM
ncbi:MAG: type IV pilus assembly protein PilM [Patescibacteria group bacterium]|jgi:type IV pilus assembly protein PilM